jgi:DNA-binding response OmpR family regulator
MKTPLWDIEPLPTLLFDPNLEHARKLATGLRKEGLPVEVAPNADAMLLTARDRYFRTLVVAADLSDAACLAFLDKLRLEAPGSWLIVTGAHADEDALAIAHRHGVDSLLAVPAAVPELFSRIAALQLRSRPRF